jgi:tRNA threonylcarbamoyladenosine biosynthesis protein TsaE
MKTWRKFIPDDEAMRALGARLAGACPSRILIYLDGDLGAGKSTLARGFIKGRGYNGHVKSPTYTLVEAYQTSTGIIYHLDLYRLSDPEELEFIGIRDIISGDATCLLEWPDKGQGLLPSPDLLVSIQHLTQGREVSIEAVSEGSTDIINRL